MGLRACSDTAKLSQLFFSISLQIYRSNLWDDVDEKKLRKPKLMKRKKTHLMESSDMVFYPHCRCLAMNCCWLCWSVCCCLANRSWNCYCCGFVRRLDFLVPVVSFWQMTANFFCSKTRINSINRCLVRAIHDLYVDDWYFCWCYNRPGTSE